jgi:hypothetical protein
VLPEMVCTRCRYRNEPAEPGLVVLNDETTALCVFPDRKSGTRGAPCVEHLVVGTRASSEPLEEVEHKRLHRVDHACRIFAQRTVAVV